LPLPGRDLPRARRRRRGTVRDPHGRRTARGREAALPGERRRGQVRRVGGDGDPGPRRGVCRLAGRIRAPAAALAARADFSLAPPRPSPMDRREFLLGASAFALAPRVRRARPLGPVALVTADLESRLVVVDLPGGRVRRYLATLPYPRSIERVGGSA